MTKRIPIKTLSATVCDGQGNEEVDLEEALERTGMGRYQVFLYILMSFSLGAVIVEMNSNSVILPTATCDLIVPDNIKGIILCLHNFGAVITAPFWGHAVDSLGRKWILAVSSAAGGFLCFLSAFMPNVLWFAICKLAGSLFLACPGSVGFAFASEFVPHKRRDTVVLICNSLITIFASFLPAFAWVIMSYQWEYDLGLIILRPWRLLTMVCAFPLILVGILTTLTHESPKYLVTTGKTEQALEVLKQVYSVNNGLSPDTYPVKSIKKLQENTQVSDNLKSEDDLISNSNGTLLEILKPPHLKWLILVSALMFGNSFLLPGLFIFSPDVMNKAMLNIDKVADGTVCLLIDVAENKTQTDDCTTDVSHSAFLILFVSSLVYGAIIILISLCPTSKRNILIFAYVSVGAGCLVSGLVSNQLVGGVAMTAIQMAAMGIGPLSAYTVELFPTNLRGKGLSIMSMFGRVGSIVGAAAAGFFLLLNCTATFWGFAALTFFCALISLLLLPSGKVKEIEKDSDIMIEHL